MPLLTQGKINWKYILIIFLLAAIIGGGVFWWANQQDFSIEFPEVKKPEKIVEDETAKLTLEELQNTEYESCNNSAISKVKFTDGYYYKPPPDPTWTTGFWSIKIIEDKIAFGDLNEDGREDVAIILNSHGGGSGSFYELVVIINDSGEPSYVSCQALGDRVIINSVVIQSGIINLDMVVHGPNDGLCCPSIEKTVKYELSENQLVEI